MSCSAAGQFFQVMGERQMTPQLTNAIAFEDHGAVVSDGVRIENAFEQRLTHEAVDLFAAVQMAGDDIVPADHDEGADAGAGQIPERSDENIGFPTFEPGGILGNSRSTAF